MTIRIIDPMSPIESSLLLLHTIVLLANSVCDINSKDMLFFCGIMKLVRANIFTD